MTRTNTPLRSAVQCAHLLLSLCAVTSALPHRGYCAGLIEPCDLTFQGLRVTRRRASARDRLRHRSALRRHLREGHDGGCHVLGVPTKTLHGLLADWGGDEVAVFLGEAVDDAVQLSLANVWLEVNAIGLLKHEIGRRLTLEPSADLEFDQMPSDPSKLPSSRRAFTWLKKRAASAPSTIR